MRRLLVILAVLAALFTAYWFTVARSVESGLNGWFAARAAEGWVAEAATLRTSGFPARFETVLTDVTLADPRTGVAWTAPRFALRGGGLPAEPHHRALAGHADGRLALGAGRRDLASGSMQASPSCPARGSKCARSRRTSRTSP